VGAGPENVSLPTSPTVLAEGSGREGGDCFSPQNCDLLQPPHHPDGRWGWKTLVQAGFMSSDDQVEETPPSGLRRHFAMLRGERSGVEPCGG
jgi:hypothetical protein